MAIIGRSLARKALRSVKTVNPLFQKDVIRHPRLKSSAAATAAVLEDVFHGIQLDTSKPIRLHKLEDILGDTSKAVDVRRRLIAEDNENARSVLKLPAAEGDFATDEFYNKVHGANCENVVGYLPVPVGVIGPLRVNDEEFYVPMATTEGALLASASRGARAIEKSGGAYAKVMRDSMTRSPVVELPTAMAAIEFAQYIEDPQNLETFKGYFSNTTNFGRLEDIKATVAGRYCFLRMSASTGDAMGMNMVGKGCNEILENVLRDVPSAKLVALSSNMCTDKKPSAMNWVNGRGKSVVCEVTIPKDVVENVLKTTIPDLVKVNTIKNLVGSSLSGSIGGNNAHSSNLVTAFFIATGQDPAQNVVSSNCMVIMEPLNDSTELHVSVTMPSIEVGTVGGGTSLHSQKACLSMLGVAGASRENPGENSKKLAEILSATVLAGELSLNAALASNNLISAHMDLNRKPASAESQSTNESPQNSVTSTKSSFSQNTQVRSLFSLSKRKKSISVDSNGQFLDPQLPVP